MRDGVETEEDDTTVKALFQKFEDYCLPKKNLIVERRFFTRNQQHDEIIGAYITQLRNLSSTCEFGVVKEGLILYKLVDGIQSDKMRGILLRKGADLTLKKAIDLCRADEKTNHEIKIIKREQPKEIQMLWKATLAEAMSLFKTLAICSKHADNVGKRITG